MKSAITSKGNSPDSRLDNRFGHCSYFVIFDNETGSTEYIPNPYKDAEEQAGIMSAKYLAGRNVSKIISGEFGIKVKPVLDSLKIQMIIFNSGENTVDDIINLIKNKITK